MMIFRCAKHGVCIGRHMIKKGEGVNDICSPIYCCWKKPPKKMISDFMCRCMPYCMQRDVRSFKDTHAKLDVWHGNENHIGCSACFSMAILKKWLPEWRCLNDQVCEQRNNGLARFKKKGTWSRLENFMLITELMFEIDNRMLLNKFKPTKYSRKAENKIPGFWFQQLQELQNMQEKPITPINKNVNVDRQLMQDDDIEIKTTMVGNV